jgi:hypothetical protein
MPASLALVKTYCGRSPVQCDFDEGSGINHAMTQVQPLNPVDCVVERSVCVLVFQWEN